MTDDLIPPDSAPREGPALAGEGEAARTELSAPEMIRQLEGALLQIGSELTAQKDKYLRLAAEYDNFRKRAVRERQEAEARGMSLLVRGILDALDDLGRFAHVDPATTDSATIQQGAEIVEKKLLKSLAGHGLEVVNPAGQPFDPALHEAVTTAPAASAEEDHLVAQVFQVGYLLNGQLLRPARVAVRQWKDASEG